MVNYYSDMIPELQKLPLNDIEKIIQALHWAIADKEKEMVVLLPNFRGGEELKVPHYEFSDLYNCFSKAGR